MLITCLTIILVFILNHNILLSLRVGLGRFSVSLKWLTWKVAASSSKEDNLYEHLMLSLPFSEIKTGNNYTFLLPTEFGVIIAEENSNIKHYFFFSIFLFLIMVSNLLEEISSDFFLSFFLLFSAKYKYMEKVNRCSKDNCL